jgi:hypothetical protein
MRAIISGMLGMIFANRNFSDDQKVTEARHLNKISGGMAFGHRPESSPYNQRQKRKRIRQNPHLAKKK